MMDLNAAPLVDVVLDDPGPRPIGIYNLVRRLHFGDLNTKQAKKLVDSAPQTILPRMARTQAEAIKIELEALGAQVRLVPASSQT
jgi:ribosomal protein L7/L12